MITIHNFARGARGIRLMWQCEEIGLPYETQLVTYPPSAAHMSLNPLGTVPVLEDAGGVVVTESVAGMLYLAQRYGLTPLLPGDARMAAVMQWTIFGETALGMRINPLIAERFGAPDADKGNWTGRILAMGVDQALAHVAGSLGDGYLVGDDLTLADISVSTAMGMFRGALDKALPDKLAAYQDRVQARPTYQRAAARAG